MATRKKNFSGDEIRVLRERYATNKGYLQSSFNNKVTNDGKNKIWADITEAINALGHEIRTINEVKHKWKNLVSTSKAAYHEHKRYRNGTGGGPPKKDPSEETLKVIDLLKDDASFRGLTGIETFAPPMPIVRTTGDEEDNYDDVEADVNIDMDVYSSSSTTTVTPIRAQPSTTPLRPVEDVVNANSGKRLHRKRGFELTTPQQREQNEQQAEIKLNLLKQEQLIQERKLENLQLEKTKLQLEIELLQQKSVNFQRENQGSGWMGVFNCNEYSTTN